MLDEFVDDELEELGGVWVEDVAIRVDQFLGFSDVGFGIEKQAMSPVESRPRSPNVN